MAVSADLTGFIMRTTSRFRTLSDTLWCVECDAYDKGVHITLRMPIVAAADGLLLYSPVPFDAEIASQIAAIGEVAHIVAPNLNHSKFIADTAARFPSARVHGVPGIERKKPGIAWAPLEGLGSDLTPLPCEGVPFTNELALFHAPSSTLICADLVQNMQVEEAFMTRQMLRMIGAWQTLGPNRWWKFNTKDPVAFRASVDAMLDCAPERISMSHGEFVESGATTALRGAMTWIPG